MDIYASLEQNAQHLASVFTDCGDIVKRQFPVGKHKELQCYVTYVDMLTDTAKIEQTIVDQLMVSVRLVPPIAEYFRDNLFDTLKDSGITTADIKEVSDFESVNLAILTGDTAVFIDGYPKAIIVSTKKFPTRGVSAADTEVVVQGSKDAFSEVFRFNTALIRRRIRDTSLKVFQTKVGRRSQTDIALMYLSDVVRPNILKEVKERLGNINIDAIIDSGYIEQLIEDDWISPFPQVQVTERPDKASAAILEGRIVVIVDNSPFVLIIPATLNTFFQSSEDYNQRWEIMSFVRILRSIAGVLATVLPGLYLATAVYHPAMISMLLVLKMAGAREMVPVPAVLEIIMMDLAFELLREAGIRLPGPIGGTMGIVGGIIIGQAAVEAGLVSPIVVIVIALTGICGFAIPHVSLVSGFRLMKYLFIVLSAFLGLYGFWLAGILCLIHLVSLKSFGIPYMFPYSSGDLNSFTDLKDSIIRVPLFMMKKRPIFANPANTTRLVTQKTGNRKKKE